MRKLIIVGLVLCISLLIGCTDGKANITQTKEEFFRDYLNLEPVPMSVSNFRGESNERFPVFLSHGYFIYKADASFFDVLVKHDKFMEANEINEMFHPVECNELPQDFSYWTDDVIKIQGKVCYEGTFIPYIHYLIYDPATREVYHFYDGVRD